MALQAQDFWDDGKRYFDNTDFFGGRVVGYQVQRRFLRFNLLKPTGYMMHQQVQLSTILRSAHTVFMRFVFI
jgi:hypothetical protein